MELLGYMRQDGSVGFRNHTLILPLTGCQHELAWRIAEQVPGAVPLLNQHGCEFMGGDFELFGKMLANLATHPNVGGVVFLTMDCAATQPLRLPELVADSGRFAETINMHRVGGTSKTIRRGVSSAKKIVRALAEQRRQTVPISSLILGTKCGSSNSDSFAYCHPVLGAACDRLVDAGATVVLSEDYELYAAADELAQRAATKETANEILLMAQKLEDYVKERFGIDLEETREQERRRSLEHASKAGTRSFQRVFDMSEKIRGQGLVILNATNTDLESMTCLAASGCQMIAFTTGKGTVCGSPVAVTVKMTATEGTWKRMRENIDLNVSGYKDGRMTLDQAAEKTVRHVFAAANGRLQKAEKMRHYEVAFPIRGVTF